MIGGSSECKVTDAAFTIQRSLRHITKDEVSSRCHADACWIVINDRVYDVTMFLNEHPGSADIILEHAGRDATCAFKDVGHSSDALVILEKHCIGQLTEEDRVVKRGASRGRPEGEL